MACFLVGGAEAVAVTAVKSHVKKTEVAAGIVDENGEQITDAHETGISWTRKLSWLQTMLWGAFALLLVEHVWHGEVVPWAPFLTAMATQADAIAMLQEIATVGVAMAALVTAVWFVATLVADALVKRPARTAAADEA